MEGYENALELFKASLYYVYFKDLPDDLIEAALTEAECLPSAVFILKSCPRIYCKWLISQTQLILLDLVGSVTTVDDAGAAIDPVVNVTDACPAPNTFLKKREILGIECEWAEVKSCLDCDASTRSKLKGNADNWYRKCKTACTSLGIGINDLECHCEPYSCESGKIRRA